MGEYIKKLLRKALSIEAIKDIKLEIKNQNILFEELKNKLEEHKSLELNNSENIKNINNYLNKFEIIKSNALIEELKSKNKTKLNHYQYTVFSQCGEDGMIDEIFKRIGTTNKQFVEFGVQDGMENNSSLLLLNGWNGLWIEGDHNSFLALQNNFHNHIEKNNLQIIEDYVTAESIQELLKKGNIDKELDLLSIDIDSNDYWVWKAIIDYNPRVVIIEYNAFFGPSTEWIRKYDTNEYWDNTNYFGASLKSFELLGQEKGYTLVGASLSGSNAFFVRNDLIKDQFNGLFTSEAIYEPIRYELIHHPGHPISRKLFNS